VPLLFVDRILVLEQGFDCTSPQGVADAGTSAGVISEEISETSPLHEQRRLPWRGRGDVIYQGAHPTTMLEIVQANEFGPRFL
jgi:hypothetical protein